MCYNRAKQASGKVLQKDYRVEGAHSFGVGFFVAPHLGGQLERWKTLSWILLITGLGAALRLAAFGSVPVGLYQDEAFNGLDALRVLAGEHPIYFIANNGREPLLIYLASISIARLGRTVAAVRLPSALLGTLTIPATAFLGSALFNKRVGILASALIAITFWPDCVSGCWATALCRPVARCRLARRPAQKPWLDHSWWTLLWVGILHLPAHLLDSAGAGTLWPLSVDKRVWEGVAQRGRVVWVRRLSRTWPPCFRASRRPFVALWPCGPGLTSEPSYPSGRPVGYVFATDRKRARDVLLVWRYHYTP